MTQMSLSSKQKPLTDVENRSVVAMEKEGVGRAGLEVMGLAEENCIYKVIKRFIVAENITLFNILGNKS